ncbi:MAG TPA: hypothetical protein VMT00_12360 [Thermoanaerobaculia bacterium]|nr:hypothetical protein [Thermoanaerobaculia bacterium]
MIRTTLRTAILVWFFALVAPQTVQPQTTPESAPAATAGAPAPAEHPSADAAEVRDQLRVVLRRYPPAIGRVLRLDPTLFHDEAYMASYPALTAFVAQHPEIARNANYYLEGVWMPVEQGPQERATELWANIMGGLAGLTVLAIVVGFITWLIRTIVEQRRWNRMSSIQAEVHNKLLDRFGSNEDLLGYIQTSPGRRFLEAAPIPLDAAAPRGVSSPLGRIFWSLQAGIVLAALGAGLNFVSRSMDPLIGPPLVVMGVVALSIGIGFVLAALVSWSLARKLGLWEAPSTDEENGSAAAG